MFWRGIHKFRVLKFGPRGDKQVTGFKAGSTTVAADVLAIPVTHGVVAKTTGADGESLTLVDGEAGQLLKIYLAAGEGDGTLTPTTKTGFASIVFADPGDQVTLLFVDTTIGWIITEASGLAAPPAITV